MRKYLIAISAMALPLAACGQQEEKPVEPEPVEVVEEPAMDSDGGEPVADPGTDPAAEPTEGETADGAMIDGEKAEDETATE